MVDLPTPPLELITATILAGTSLFVYMLACLHTSLFSCFLSLRCLGKAKELLDCGAITTPLPRRFLQSLEELAQSETRPVSPGGRGLLPAGEGRGETKLASH